MQHGVWIRRCVWSVSAEELATLERRPAITITVLMNLPNFFFYVYGSVHRWYLLTIVQWDATQSSLFIILQVHSTCFGCQQHPSSRVHKTVTTACGTGRTFCAAASLQRGQASLATLEGGRCMVPEAVVTVLCTPDNGCGWHPKHVQ